MSKRKTAQQRIEEYRTRAAEIEKREARKLLRQSPQWKLTLAAMDKLTEALAVMDADTNEANDDDALYDALSKASDALYLLATDRVL